MLVEEDRFCVTRCSKGFYSDHLNDDRRCLPCANGECPKVCDVDNKIDAVTIRQLINCTKIEGNIEILNHVFSEHAPDNFDPNRPIEFIPALTAKDLEVLKSVKVVTGHVVIDGGVNDRSGDRPRSLDFLENLESIEGQKLYYDKFSLFVINNYHLNALGLKSLRKIRSGAIGFRQNRNLCYGRNIPFKDKYQVTKMLWEQNMPDRECGEFLSRN